MKRIALISVTLNAVNPLAKLFAKHTKDFEVKNYLDEGLQALVAREGGVTDKSLSRMFALIGKASLDGAEAVLLTCTVFSPYVERFNTLFSIPVIGVDAAMLDEAAGFNKKTAVLCTFPATMKSSPEMFKRGAEHHGVNPPVDFFLVEDAAQALKKEGKEAHDKIIAEKALSLEKDYDLIVLAQISMAGAAELLLNCTKPVLTSPESALRACMDLLKK
jgi:Asp/Glu/hydantoin racemase